MCLAKILGKIFNKQTEEDTGPRSSYEEMLYFLEQADLAYIEAYETRNMAVLKDYFTRECILSVGALIRNTSGMRYFANEKFRSTSWQILNSAGENVTVRKSVVFSEIKVAGSTKMKVSQDYEETWDLLVTDEEILVTNVLYEG